ncbi:MAG: hypothetical protein IJ860_10970 [Eubacterium sp.]|nr:hypothetical protein [Eubacterium sp.]
MNIHPTTKKVLLVIDLLIIGLGLLLQFGVIPTQTPPGTSYFLGPYLLLLTLLLSYYRAYRTRKQDA